MRPKQLYKHIETIYNHFDDFKSKVLIDNFIIIKRDNYYDEEVQDQALQGFKFLEASVGKGRTIHYKLVNHTDKIWITSWYHECNFYTVQEIRDNILNKLEI